jgi:hypothetical protein
MIDPNIHMTAVVFRLRGKLNYLIDNKAGIIVDAEGTRANRAAEIAITETMVERIKGRFGLRPTEEHRSSGKIMTSKRSFDTSIPQNESIFAVRVWKKRPELQAHSRIRVRNACGLPVATEVRS